MKLHDNYDVGIYCRLSRDDHNGNLESMSIANQRQVLVDYVTEKGWTLRECYIDDGYTGTNFDRPDFRRMIQDAESGKIDCIITKDLSRLGRNYVQSGYYTEEYFIEKRLFEVDDRIKNLYEDKCLGKIPEDIVIDLIKNFTAEKNELEEKLPTLKNKIASINETVGNINEWLDMISSYENITELDREIVCGLVESVTVFEKDKSKTPVTQEIKIEYRFIKNLLQKEKEDIA